MTKRSTCDSLAFFATNFSSASQLSTHPLLTAIVKRSYKSKNKNLDELSVEENKEWPQINSKILSPDEVTTASSSQSGEEEVLMSNPIDLSPKRKSTPCA